MIDVAVFHDVKMFIVYSGKDMWSITGCKIAARLAGMMYLI